MAALSLIIIEKRFRIYYLWGKLLAVRKKNIQRNVRWSTSILVNFKKSRQSYKIVNGNINNLDESRLWEGYERQ